MIFRAFLPAAFLAALFPLAALAETLQMPSRATPAAPLERAELREPDLHALHVIALDAPDEKAQRVEMEGGRLRIATVRALGKAAPVTTWMASDRGYVTRIDAKSSTAQGLRVRLQLRDRSQPLDVRVQGEDGRVESMRLDPAVSTEAWTPWTEGATQRIEVFGAAPPAPDALEVGAVLHFNQSPLAKGGSAICTISTLCPTGDAALDGAVADRRKSVVRINFVEGGGGYICSATLLNSERASPYLLTAEHCLATPAAAASLSSFWFLDSTSCTDLATSPGFVQKSAGAQLVFANFAADATLLQMNEPPPPGATYAGWSTGRLSGGEAVVSISHPQGDTGRLATGFVTTEYRLADRPLQDEYAVRFDRGITEGGSSGSGLFTLSGGSLTLRGVLTGTTITNGPMSCQNRNEEAVYGRFDIFGPQIAQYLSTSPRPADDAPNRFQDWAAVALDPSGADMPLNQRGSPLAIGPRNFDYIGDVDVYRFNVTARTTVTAWSEGATDTIAWIVDGQGAHVVGAANDDAQRVDTNFGLTTTLNPGTYYLMVAPWDPNVTGSYTVRMRTDNVDTNYTDLWWNAAEPGWGINVNHQGTTLFATLFTYDLDGSQMWLVMSSGARQADGSYSGDLFRTQGPVFNASPWSAVSNNVVGTMRLRFASAEAGTLAYTVNGVSVTKAITRQTFSTRPNCGWSAFDRSYARNFQDLWWNPAEPGWGINVTHQGNIVFATLFTYAANGRGMWLVLPNGARASTATYTGTLYRTTGPPFNAAPWSANTNVAVGTMTLQFSDGSHGILNYSVDGVQVSKPIVRQVFSDPRTECE